MKFRYFADFWILFFNDVTDRLQWVQPQVFTSSLNHGYNYEARSKYLSCSLVHCYINRTKPNIGSSFFLYHHSPIFVYPWFSRFSRLGKLQIYFLQLVFRFCLRISFFLF